jgi:hypothetical protein
VTCAIKGDRSDYTHQVVVYLREMSKEECVRFRSRAQGDAEHAVNQLLDAVRLRNQVQEELGEVRRLKADIHEELDESFEDGL